MALSPVAPALLKYFSQLNDSQKTSLLELIRTFLFAKDELGGQTIDQYNQQLDQAMDRVSKGEVTSLEDLEREMGMAISESSLIEDWENEDHSHWASFPSID